MIYVNRKFDNRKTTLTSEAINNNYKNYHKEKCALIDQNGLLKNYDQNVFAEIIPKEQTKQGQLFIQNEFSNKMRNSELTIR